MIRLRRAAAYRATWLVILLLFVAFGWRTLWNEIRQPPALRLSPNASVDTFLETFLGIDRGAERVAAAIAQLPPDQPVLFVAPPEDQVGQFLAYALSYLTWPRRIVWQPGAANGASGSVIFFRVSPPAPFEMRARLGADCVVGLLPQPRT